MSCKCCQCFVTRYFFLFLLLLLSISCWLTLNLPIAMCFVFVFQELLQRLLMLLWFEGLSTSYDSKDVSTTKVWWCLLLVVDQTLSAPWWYEWCLTSCCWLNYCHIAVNITVLWMRCVSYHWPNYCQKCLGHEICLLLVVDQIMSALVLSQWCLFLVFDQILVISTVVWMVATCGQWLNNCQL